MLVDGGAAIVDPASAAAIERVDIPSMLLWAPRGVLDQTPGLYSAAQIDEAGTELVRLSAQLVDDADHYTIAVGETGARAVAAAIVGE